MKRLPLILLTALAGPALLAETAAPEIVPAVKAWRGAETGEFRISKASRVVTAKDANRALVAYASLFAHELGIKHAAGAARKGDIEMALKPSADKSRAEHYTLEARQDGVTITGEGPLGAYWGTRTLKQSLDRTGAFPCGTAEDGPDYPVRGFMFDCGRKPFALTTLRTLVDICSYYKLNDLQLHLSDNYIWLHNYPGVKTPDDILKHEPSAGGFRLESKIRGLASDDLAYTKEEFRKLVGYARKRGVKIVPELDVPGHALQLVRVRPDLMYRGDVGRHKDIERAAMLDLKNPKTFEFVASVFDEYIDSGTFANDIVHIGTDEYYGDAESYRAFADKLLRHIRAKGKTPRLWGSLTKKQGLTPVLADGVEMHIWSLDWQRPVEAVKAGYKIINILDRFVYSVPNGRGDVGAYCDDIDARWLYENWTPRTFPNTPADQLPKEKVLGGAWAMWNDNSFMTDPGLCGRDLVARIRRNCAALGAKCWTEAKPAQGWDAFLEIVESDAERLGATDPKPWSRTYRVRRSAEKAQKIAESDETTLYAATPHDGKVGFRREGALYSFDFALPKGKTVELTISSADRKTTLAIDGQEVGGAPRRQHFPDACKFFTLPDPGR